MREFRDMDGFDDWFYESSPLEVFAPPFRYWIIRMATWPTPLAIWIVDGCFISEGYLLQLSLDIVVSMTM
jgi:hypothetical protein